MIGWFVAATRPRGERVAEHHLSNQDFDTFLPLRKKTVRRGRKWITKPAPLFPGYLFIHFDAATNHWRPVNNTIGVKHLVMQDERPVPLPHGLVEALSGALAEDGTRYYDPGLANGDRVELAAGPFAGNIGELIELDDRGRVAVLLEILSTTVPVHTRIDNLLPA